MEAAHTTTRQTSESMVPRDSEFADFLVLYVVRCWMCDFLCAVIIFFITEHHLKLHPLSGVYVISLMPPCLLKVLCINTLYKQTAFDATLSSKSGPHPLLNDHMHEQQYRRTINLWSDAALRRVVLHSRIRASRLWLTRNITACADVFSPYGWSAALSRADWPSRIRGSRLRGRRWRSHHLNLLHHGLRWGGT